MKIRTMLGLTLLAVATACGGDNSATAPDDGNTTQPLSAISVTPSATGATVDTDKDDYAPGEVVTIIGRGWKSGEAVHLNLTEDPVADGPHDWDVVADADGNFTYSSFSPGWQHLDVRFTLTATGGAGSGSSVAVFTDGTFALGSNLPAGTLINVGWRIFGSGFAPANTNCSGSPSVTGTANNVGAPPAPSVATGTAPNALRSIEFTAPAVAGYAFVGYALSTTPNTIISSNAVICFPGTPSGSVKYILKYVLADATPPVISYVLNPAAPDGNNGWYVNNVSLVWTVTEAESPGSLVKTGCVNQNITADQASTTYSCSATSTGGSAAQVDVSIKRDATDPVVTVTGVVNGATYQLGSVPVAGCNTTDAMSGVFTSATVGTTGGPVVGSFTANCTGAADNAGNTNSASATYNVIYVFSGLFQPIDNIPSWNSVRAGSNVPVKFSLGGDMGLNVIAAGYPQWATIPCNTNPSLTVGTSTESPGGSVLTYDPISNQYHYNWKTNKDWAGTCVQLIVKLTDGTYHRANFIMQK
jgi:hypothetical protein